MTDGVCTLQYVVYVVITLAQTVKHGWVRLSRLYHSQFPPQSEETKEKTNEYLKKQGGGDGQLGDPAWSSLCLSSVTFAL